MKTPRNLLMLLAAALFVPAIALADDHAAGGEMDFDAMMKEWMEMSTPGEAHSEMAKMAGDWTYQSTSYWGPEPTVTEGTMHVETTLGGRYMHALHKGEMMGMPFEGVGVTGFDNATQEYFNVWMDNMSTGVLVSKGKHNDSGQLEMVGSMNGPGGVPMEHRMVLTYPDDDHHTFEMYGPGPDGSEMLMMKAEYTRVME